MYMKPRGFAFDLDETLTPSKEPVEAAMAQALSLLARLYPIAIVSGASKERIEKQIVDRLNPEARGNLILYPTCGAAAFTFSNSLCCPLYELKLTGVEHKKIVSVLERIVRESGLLQGQKTYGPQIEFRGSQVTFSALGQEAPYAEKSLWDKDKKKRLGLRARLMKELPEFDIALGGTTSIDIVQKGIDKAYAVRHFAKHLGMEENEVCYVGDDLKEGGNDYIVATHTRAVIRPVRDPKDTLAFIGSFL